MHNILKSYTAVSWNDIVVLWMNMYWHWSQQSTFYSQSLENVQKSPKQEKKQICSNEPKSTETTVSNFLLGAPSAPSPAASP